MNSSLLSHKTISTDRGYAIIKDKFNFRDINRTRKELTLTPFINDGYGAPPSSFPIYLESQKKIYVPKHYGYETFGNPDKIKNINKGLSIDLEFNGNLRDSQEEPVKLFLESCEDGSLIKKSKGGIISLACGGGKTIISLYLLSKLKKKTLIIVHKEFLINQWKERILQFLPYARVGIIQSKKINIKNKDIVIGMLQSISMKEYPPDTFKDFGFTIIDECHHIGAEVFSRALPKINCYYSLGLSATPNRKDGLSKVFHWYLGPMIYEKTTREGLLPIHINVTMYKYNDTQYNKIETTNLGKVCMARMINNITECNRRNEIIFYLLLLLRSQNKKILILSDRRKHLTYIHDEVNNRNIGSIGYYVGGMKERELKDSENKEILLGTYTMSSEGMDIPDLDAVIFASPRSDIVQSIGRILRKKHATNPICWDIVDDFSAFSKQYIKRRIHYRKMKYPIKIYKIDDDIDIPLDKMIKQFNQSPLEDIKGKKKKTKKLIDKYSFIED